MTTPQDQSAQRSPQDHLKDADAALSSISTSAVTGKAKSQIDDLKKHVNELEKIAGEAPAGASAKGTPKWASEAAAADKILSGAAGCRRVHGRAECGDTDRTQADRHVGHDALEGCRSSEPR